DYVVHRTANRLTKYALVAATALLVLLGTLVVFTFDPCPANGLAANLPDFCKAVK
ncbi:MAG: succinate dehydrogenase / fumarate reductase, rane anchor subunit, partial [Microbacteriaceae bacterium]|nr:succinate dehydrogenase / fumarate reductase, rane anchor subunit [Microbacteriaceae bacterium]